MSKGLTEQIEHQMHSSGRNKNPSGKKTKVTKHRYERRKANRDPETAPNYRKYSGWEY